MRTINSLQKVIEKAQSMSQNYFDESIPIIDMEFDSLEKMWISGKPIDILPSAQRLFSNKLRIPYSYLARCPTELQAKNLNHWLKEEREKRTSLFCRFDSNSLRAVFTNRYTAIDHTEVFSRILEYGFDPEVEVHCSLDHELLILRIPDFTRTFNLREKDGIVPGISIANSEVGILAFSIEGYFYRLVCSNGMISKSLIASRFKHVSKKALEQFPDILRQVVYESGQNQGKFAISTQSDVDNPLSTIGSFNRQFSINKKEAEIIERAWEQEKGYTMFHVINAYTRAAHDESLSSAESYKLEQIGGVILSLVKN